MTYVQSARATIILQQTIHREICKENEDPADIMRTLTQN